MSRLAGVLIGALVVAIFVVVGLVIRNAGRAGAGMGGAPVQAPANPEAIDAVLNSADTYFKQQDFAKGDAVLVEGMRTYPGEPRLPLLRAEQLIARDRREEALGEFEKAISLGAGDIETLFHAATCAASLKKFERAIELYQLAQAKDPKSVEITLYLAQAQAAAGQVPQAKANLLVAGQLDPERAIVWATLAELTLRENKAELALQHVEKARRLDPASVVYRLIEARALKRLRRAEEALALLAGLSLAEQREPGVLGVMGECYGLLRQPGEAARLMVRHADADPTSAELAALAGEWLERAGEGARAKEYAQRARQLGWSGATPPGNRAEADEPK